MAESRCGILCGECEFSKTMGCKGCVNIQNLFGRKAAPSSLAAKANN